MLISGQLSLHSVRFRLKGYLETTLPTRYHIMSLQQGTPKAELL